MSFTLTYSGSVVTLDNPEWEDTYLMERDIIVKQMMNGDLHSHSNDRVQTMYSFSFNKVQYNKTQELISLLIAADGETITINNNGTALVLKFFDEEFNPTFDSRGEYSNFTLNLFHDPDFGVGGL